MGNLTFKTINDCNEWVNRKLGRDIKKSEKILK